jgi:hypothetical protein
MHQETKQNIKRKTLIKHKYNHFIDIIWQMNSTLYRHEMANEVHMLWTLYDKWNRSTLYQILLLFDKWNPSL